ncbi:MAG: 50S ribosomal protein L6 [Gammaproteobacteria bacterium]|nr:50S ribosomal protein L6 [Gammaproteobacteria bacterium]
MSRIGKMPVPVPSGIKVEIKGTHIKISGPKGSLERNLRPEIECTEEANQLIFTPKGTSKKVMSFWGMTRSLVNNMVVGVDKGFSKQLVIEGVGYRANLSGNTITLNVGYSNPVEFKLPDGISAEVGKDNSITISGIDKELVGLITAQIRAIRKPEPYKGKGIRYVDERIIRKVGKAGAAS